MVLQEDPLLWPPQLTQDELKWLDEHPVKQEEMVAMKKLKTADEGGNSKEREENGCNKRKRGEVDSISDSEYEPESEAPTPRPSPTKKHRPSPVKTHVHAPFHPAALTATASTSTGYSPSLDYLIIHLKRLRLTWTQIASFIPSKTPGALQVRYSSRLSKLSPAQVQELYNKGNGGGKGYSTEMDDLIVWLKEEKGMGWKKIAEYLPGKTTGAVQVRYSSKLARR
ncbi:hypothetical protein YB2330_001072 [Saitoella coloradoensis]